MKIRITSLATIIVSFLCIFIGHKIVVKNLFIFQNDSQEVVKAVVYKIIERIEPDESYDELIPMSMQSTSIIFEAKVTGGRQKGNSITAVQNMGEFSEAPSTEVKEGDSVLLINFDHREQWYFKGFVRADKLFVLGILFLVCLLLLGRAKGLSALLSLGLTCGTIIGVFIPAILSGKNIYLMTVLVCVYIIVMTFLIVIGYNKKALAAVLGCCGGIAVSGIISIIMDRVLFLTGVIDERTGYIAHLPLAAPLNLKALIFAGIVIGAMGAVMDMAMSITSSLWELKQRSQGSEFKTLFHSGMTIGRDMMGTMVNTLILAYIGSSLSIVIIFAIYDNSFLSLLNSEMIIVDILQALAGTLGILAAMPLTALFCSVFYGKQN